MTPNQDLSIISNSNNNQSQIILNELEELIKQSKQNSSQKTSKGVNFIRKILRLLFKDLSR
ncbi:hypothetical protein Ple7327_4250 [Pleurocapsa sp. PCC 7327]|nr:hypothetical protein Ple7327_4250 [Pleurocapsa sp. PCC 7327]